MKQLTILLTTTLLLTPITSATNTALDHWDLLDMTGDAQITEIQVLNPPPGYGPQVLQLEGDLILSLLKDQELDTGDILVLYRELNPRDKDADGIILFHADYGDDIRVEHNTKLKRPQAWLELDNDSGIHFRAIGNDGEERAYDENPGQLLVTDDWNITNWIWQRVRITPDRILGRAWPAHKAEPDTWHLDTQRFTDQGRRFGLRVSSGAVQVAHFEWSQQALNPIPAAVPWLFIPKDEYVSPSVLTWQLFTDQQPPEGNVDAKITWNQHTADILIHPSPTNNPPSSPYTYTLHFAPTTFSLMNLPLPEGQVTLKAFGTKGIVRISHDQKLRVKINQAINRHTFSSIHPFRANETIHWNAQYDLASMANKALNTGDRDLALLRLEQSEEAFNLFSAARTNNNQADYTQKNEPHKVDASSRIIKRTTIDSSISLGKKTLLRMQFPGAHWAEVEHPNGETIRWTAPKENPHQHPVFVITPTMSYYTVRWKNQNGSYESPIVGPVVETKDSQLYVNGEPFIVKGVNVHSLDAGNPERTRKMMQSLKALGFNMLRGDYPPTWEVEMAEEENLFWTILGPFSVCSTDDIQTRQDGSLMGKAREIAMDHILEYRDYAGTLLWNSSNEITGDTTAFLENLYPVYKHLDPYQRPVHYANLFGQDRHQGQDAVGINYYFAKGQTPTDKYPLIQKSIDLARAENKPVFYTEYNSYQGPDPEGGVMAMEGLFEWGVEQGMSGGFFYMGPTSSDHPGVWLDHDLNIDPRMAKAFHKAFDDALLYLDGKTRTLRVQNIRPYTLRNCILSQNGKILATLREIPPNQNAPFSDITQDQLTAPLTLSFETHYGIHSTITINPANLPVTLTQEELEQLEALSQE